MDSKPSVRFEVEKVIGVSSDGNVRTYQVQWAPAWVSTYHLVGCEHLIQEFLQQQTEKVNELEPPVVVAHQPHDQSTNSQDVNQKSHEALTMATSVAQEDKHLGESNAVPQPAELMLSERNSNMSDVDVSNDLEKSLTNPDTECMVVSFREELSKLESKFDISSEQIDLPVKVEADDDLLDDVDTSLLFVISKEDLSNINHNNSVIVNPTEQENPISRDNMKDGSSHSNNQSTTLSLSNNALTSISYEHVCSVCSSRFERACDLNLHFRSHSKPYACTHCEKTFSQNSNLKRHLRIHTGEKLYTCSRCGKTFSQKVHLDRHIRIHSDEEPGWKGGWVVQ